MIPDVCLILEGTFPYVVGGVSAWVNDLIKGLPDVTFGVVHISPLPSTYRELKYPFPKNLIQFKEVYLFDYQIEPHGAWSLEKRQAGRVLTQAYNEMMKGNLSAFADLLAYIHAGADAPLNLHDFIHSRGSWEFLLETYAAEKTEPSFIDYFWTWRLLHLPIIQVLRAQIPEARIYHAVSTGYAGLLSAAARVRTGRPLILTEHGIYTRERKIEILHAGWIHSDLPASLSITHTRDFFRDWWVRMFGWMSRLTYHHADHILTLFERNRTLQIEEGAAPERTRVIPNGVILSKLSSLAATRGVRPFDPPVLAFVGRVVPIKDVKTFLKTLQPLIARWPKLDVLVAGPTDEDTPYYQECEQLARALDLGRNVTFLGRVNVETIYAKTDLVMLTSISEAQPLVLLEAMACGIPCVATDVGACRELLEGRTRADLSLGPSGLIASVGDAAALSAAAERILGDPHVYRQMAVSGRKRVERFYRQDVILAQYQSLYESKMNALA